MVQILKLSNEIPVIYEYMADRRSTAFGVFVKMGSAVETQEENGISHFIEHMLFKGTSTYSSKELADIMSDLGGDINAYTAKELTSYYGRVLNEDFDQAIKIMSSMLLDSSFEKDEIEKEKSVIIDEIELYEDSPEEMCHEILQKYIWPDSAYGYLISGSDKNVKSFDREQIVKAWKENYIGDHFVISITGGESSEQVLQVLEKYFGQIPIYNKELKYSQPIYRKCFFVESKQTEQLHMNIAFDNVSSVDEERFPMSILNACIGGNLNARLFQKIREELGLTYSIYSYSSMFQKAGLFHIYASMNPKQATKVVFGIIDIIEELRNTGISEEEIEIIKKQMKTELILAEESSTSRMDANAKSYMAFGKIEEMDETLDKLSRVTKEDVDQCIIKYLDFSKSSVALMGKISKKQSRELEKIWDNNEKSKKVRRK